MGGAEIIIGLGAEWEETPGDPFESTIVENNMRKRRLGVESGESHLRFHLLRH